MPGHPSVAILPALLALAEAQGAAGRDVIAAFVAGYETACRIGAALRPGHYNLGFHCDRHGRRFWRRGRRVRPAARPRGASDRRGARHRRYARSPGSSRKFGTMCKPFHAGKAAQNGLLAARLAARGFSSRADIIECVQGFALTHGPDFVPGAALAGHRNRAAPRRQPLQIPCRVLSDACADRMRPPAARAAPADP